MNLDLLIRNADLADGTGAPLRRADVAVRDGRIEAIAAAGEIEATNAAEVIEAKGLLVTGNLQPGNNHQSAQPVEAFQRKPSTQRNASVCPTRNHHEQTPNLNVVIMDCNFYY